MSKLLTSAQCDAFMRQFPNVRVQFISPSNGWLCYLESSKAYGHTRQDAITHYWQNFEPAWQPPEIHDAEWALEYIKTHSLNIEIDYSLKPPHRYLVWGGGVNVQEAVRHGDLITAVESWIEKYGKLDLPTPLEMLQEIVDSYSHSHDPDDMLKRARAVVAREKERINNE